MTFLEYTSTPDLIERWPYDFQRIPNGSDQYHYLSAYATELRRIDTFIDELYEQRFIETATGIELEKLAAPLGVTRRAGESDESLRYRARLGKLISASDGTASHFESIVSAAFPGAELTNIEISNVDGAPVIELLVPENVVDSVPISLSETEDLMTLAVPSGHAVRVITDNTWLIGEGGSSGLGEGGLS